MQLITAEGQFHKMASDIKVHMKQRYAAEFLHEKKKKAPINIHQYLMNVHGDQTVDVSTVRRFSSGNNDMKDK